MESLTQRDIFKKWAFIIARQKSYAVNDILRQIKNWIPQWEILDFDDGNIIEYNFDENDSDKFDIYIMENEIISADSAINSSFRQVTGSFYTPPKWALYMVKRSLNIWLCDILNISYDNVLYPLDSGLLCELSEKEYKAVFNQLIKFKIIDIACGSGVFLISAVKEIERILNIVYKKLLKKNNKFVNAILSDFPDIESLNQHIALEIVNGWDTNADALALYALWFIYRYGMNSRVKSPVACVDSLSDKVMIGVDKYDMVIGNPPYLGEKGNKEIFDKIKTTNLGKNHYIGKMDLSYFFVARALELLKDNGILTYIMTNYFITADGAKNLREHIKNTAYFIEIFNLNTLNIFCGAKGQHNIIYTLKKRVDTDGEDILNKSVLVKNCVNISDEHQCCEEHIDSDDIYDLEKDLIIDISKQLNHYYCSNYELYRENNNIVLYLNPEHKDFLFRYENICDKTWGDIFDIKQGIVSGADRLTRRMMDKVLGKDYCDKNKLEDNMPIFVFENKEIDNYKIERTYLKPFYKNSDISKYIIRRCDKQNLWIAYTNGVSEKELEKKAPNLFNYLKKFKKILYNRREVRAGSRAWYELQWARNQEIFDTTKMVVPHRNKYNKFAFVDFAMYGSADIYYFKLKNNLYGKELDNWYYNLAIANSSIMYMWLYNYGKKKGDILELYGQPLSRVKIPSYKGLKWQKQIVNLVSVFMEKYNVNKRDLKNTNDIFKLYESDELHLRINIDKCIFDELGFDDKTRKYISEFAGVKS